jgi:hypothetical protein
MPDKSDRPDTEAMRHLEERAREIGHIIGRSIEHQGLRFGFALFLFSFDGPEMTWISNANRDDMIKGLLEFIERQGCR